METIIKVIAIIALQLVAACCFVASYSLHGDGNNAASKLGFFIGWFFVAIAHLI